MSNSGQGLQGTKMEYSAMLSRHYSSPDEVSLQEQLRYFLSTTEETVIGRAPECEIVLEPSRYSTVSRYHAKIRLLANNSQPAWEISNLSTTNGTYVNGKQIERCQLLQPGDRITLSWQGPEFLFGYQSLPATVLIPSPVSESQRQELSSPAVKQQQKVSTLSNPSSIEEKQEKAEVASGELPPELTPLKPVAKITPSTADETPVAEIAIAEERQPVIEAMSSPSAPVTVEPEPVERQFQAVTSSSAVPAQQPRSEVSLLVEPVSASIQVSPALPAVGKTLWELGTQEHIRTLPGHADAVRAVAFSPDGQVLASGSADKTIKLWNLNMGQEVVTLTGHKLAVNVVAFSPDGQILASGSADKTIKLWNLNTGEEIASLTGHSSAVNAVAFSPDGQVLASGSADKTIKLWDLKTNAEVRILDGHKLGLNAVAFSPNGQMLASGSADKMIKLWNVNTGEEISSLPALRSAVNAIAFSPNGKTLASGTEDKLIKLWDLSTGEEVYTFCGYTWQVSAIAISPNGQTLASGSSDKTIKLWQL